MAYRGEGRRCGRPAVMWLNYAKSDPLPFVCHGHQHVTWARENQNADQLSGAYGPA